MGFSTRLSRPKPDTFKLGGQEFPNVVLPFSVNQTLKTIANVMAKGYVV